MPRVSQERSFIAAISSKKIKKPETVLKIVDYVQGQGVSRSAVARKASYGGTSAKAQSRLRRDEHRF